MKDKLFTWHRLGLKNIATVASYRILKKLGYYRRVLPVTPLGNSSIFSESVASRGKPRKVSIDYFSFHSIDVKSPPNWFINPWNNKYKSGKNRGGVLQQDQYRKRHWSELPDFIPELGDIKLVWELSRFDWLPKMAWAYKQGDKQVLPLLELWLRDWIKHNPVNSGINWKCGQEASLRCLNLLTSSLMIDNNFHKPNEGLLSLLESHASRITPTLHYAMAQDNNHGTSEAAALFIVGEYLVLHGNAKQKKLGVKWSSKGRYWLENRVSKLVMGDGSFSQYSVTYHRLFLDSLAFVELYREHFDLKEFSAPYYKKMKLASKWLYYMTDENNKNAPNLGANDGAYLFNIENNPYRDFRPSIQLSSVVFLKENPRDDSVQHPLLTLFNIDTNKLPPSSRKPATSLFKSGGYAVIRKKQGFAMMRLPIFKFRPSHADAHHVDIWHNGINIIRDGGTYSYNTDEKLLTYFSGTQSHSTVQFDNRDQMPRLGRFLFGNWLKPSELNFDESKTSIASSYKDSMGVSHKRSLLNTEAGWKVIDKFEDFSSHATLRWRLSAGNWTLDGNKLMSDSFDIEIKSYSKLSLKLLEGYESLYYMDKTKIPILEVTCKEFGTIESIITLH